MKRFREFVNSQPVVFRLREEDAAQTPSAPSPDNPDSTTTNKYHFDKLQDELDIDDAAMKGAIEGGVQTLYKVPDYGWGFRVQPPVQATVKQIGDGQYKVTFLLTQASRRKMVLPYKQGQTPLRYDGPIENKTVMMNKEELADLIVPPYEAAAGGAAGMGGGPPMGPPGAAPPGAGSPIAGGVPPIGGAGTPPPTMGGIQ